MQKYVLVTSSTRGIGKAIGKIFLEKGYYVFLNHCNNYECVELLKQELIQYKYKYSIIKADMSNLDGIDVLYNNIINITNKLDCVVLNTGITNRSSFDDLTFDEWNKVMNTNLNIPFFLIQRLNNMINNNGRIIFIGSILGAIPHGTSIPYAISKSGLNMLSRSLVKVFKDRKITVNTIDVGFIDTSWHETKTVEHRKNIENKIALNRFGKPEEVAQLCMSIVENDYINGSIINIDGGYDME